MELIVKSDYFGIQSTEINYTTVYKCNLKCQNSTKPTIFTVIYYQVFSIQHFIIFISIFLTLL